MWASSAFLHIVMVAMGSTLKSREITADTPNYPNDALHVYRLNVDVDSRNTVMLKIPK